MTGTSDGNDRSIPAHYQIDGDTPTFCFHDDYKPASQVQEDLIRPASLDASAGSHQVLMV